MVGIKVDPSNQAAAQAWDGGDGAKWANDPDRFDRSLAGYRRILMEAAAVQPADQVLDIGCGNGETTRDCAIAATSGGALGIDLSSAMLEVARSAASAQGITNIRFEHGDAQVYPFEPGSIDLVVSRMGSMFFGDRDAAFANIASAVRPGGRLAMLVWQDVQANPWVHDVRTALSAGRDLPMPVGGSPGPFGLADPDESRRVLDATGFTDIEIDGVSAEIWWGDDVEDAHGYGLMIHGWLLDGLPEEDVRRAHDDLRMMLEAHLTPEGVMFDSACWLIRATK